MSFTRSQAMVLALIFVNTEEQSRRSDPSFMGAFEAIKIIKSCFQRTGQRLEAVSWTLELKETELMEESFNLQKEVEVFASIRPEQGVSRKEVHALKLEYDREGRKLENQITGVTLLAEFIEIMISQMSIRTNLCQELEDIGRELAGGRWPVEYGKRFEDVYAEMAAGVHEIREIESVLEVLPSDWKD